MLKQVEEFHKTFDQPVLDLPTIPNKDRCELRIKLIQEELNELKEAIENNDIVEVADALCDIQYVLSGTILEFGLKDKLEDLFNEVQRSNMSKACDSYTEAENTRDKYWKESKTDSYIKEKEDKFLVYRTEDDKVLKSIDYSKANLKAILDD